MELRTSKKSLFSTFGIGAFGKMASLIKNTDYLPQKPTYLFKLLKMAYSLETKKIDIAKELTKDKETVAQVLNIPSLQDNYESIEQEDLIKAINNVEKSFMQNVLEINAAQKYHKAIAHKMDDSTKARWHNSIKAAIIARSVAKWAGYEQMELAFFATLLSELPSMILATSDANAQLQVQAKMDSGMGEKEAELVVHGFDRTEFGAKLFKYYSMPSELVDLAQHDYKVHKVKSQNAKLARIVEFSKYIAQCFSDKTQSPSSIWAESQTALEDLEMQVSNEEWGNKISLMFVKSLEFEMSVTS